MSPYGSGRRLPRSSFGVSTCFSDEPANRSPEVLTVAPSVDPSLALSERGPYLVGGITTLDDASCTTTIAVHSEANAPAPFGPRCWFTADLHQAQRLGSHALGGGRIHHDRREIRSSIPGYFWRICPSANFDERPSKRQFVRADEPTCSLVVWTSVVPPKVMQYAALLDRGS